LKGPLLTAAGGLPAEYQKHHLPQICPNDLMPGPPVRLRCSHNALRWIRANDDIVALLTPLHLLSAQYLGTLPLQRVLATIYRELIEHYSSKDKRQPFAAHTQFIQAPAYLVQPASSRELAG